MTRLFSERSAIKGLRESYLGFCQRLLWQALCVGPIAAFAACSPAAPDVAEDASATRPNVLLITLDTTRADHLGCYGYERDTSPNLDALAASGQRYTNAYATSSWTLATHASIFTGKLPSSHGAQYDSKGQLRLSQGIAGPWDAFGARPIAANALTLASLLQAHGYATAGVVAGPWLKSAFQLNRGFEYYDDEKVTDTAGRIASRVTVAALAWLDGHLAGRDLADRRAPFFLFLNYFDPHGPFDPPESFRARYLPDDSSSWSGDQLDIALYDAEIHYMDLHIGRLLDGLRERGVLDDTLVVVTADHGELLGEGGFKGHGTSLFEGEIRVPLIVRDPPARSEPNSASVVDHRVSQTDLLPTILARLAIEAPPDIQGQTLDVVDHPIVAQVVTLPKIEITRKSWRRKGGWQMLLEGEWKLLLGTQGRHQLYNLANDPDEARDLAAEQPERVQRMEQRLRSYLAALPAAEDPVAQDAADEELLDALRGLGYLGESD